MGTAWNEGQLIKATGKPDNLEKICPKWLVPSCTKCGYDETEELLIVNLVTTPNQKRVCQLMGAAQSGGLSAAKWSNSLIQVLTAVSQYCWNWRSYIFMPGHLEKGSTQNGGHTSPVLRWVYTVGQSTEMAHAQNNWRWQRRMQSVQEYDNKKCLRGRERQKRRTRNDNQPLVEYMKGKVLKSKEVGINTLLILMTQSPYYYRANAEVIRSWPSTTAWGHRRTMWVMTRGLGSNKHDIIIILTKGQNFDVHTHPRKIILKFDKSLQKLLKTSQGSSSHVRFSP